MKEKSKTAIINQIAEKNQPDYGAFFQLFEYCLCGISSHSKMSIEDWLKETGITPSVTVYRIVLEYG